MIVGMYSVFDRKSDVFGTPFFTLNDALAQRYVYMREKADPGQLSEFPEDFLLVQLGTFDPQLGEVKPEQNKFRPVQEVRNFLKNDKEVKA